MHPLLLCIRPKSQAPSLRPASGSHTGKENLVDAGLQRFAAAAWGSPQIVVDGWMQAPVGTCFLGKPVLGSTLYVRQAYTALHDKLEELKKRGTAHVVISGNPGMGKSWFALYMLVRQGLLRMSSHYA